MRRNARATRFEFSEPPSHKILALMIHPSPRGRVRTSPNAPQVMGAIKGLLIKVFQDGEIQTIAGAFAVRRRGLEAARCQCAAARCPLLLPPRNTDRVWARPR